MSAPKATEAAVAAVQQALGCEKSTECPEPYCLTHSVNWHEEGCGDVLAAIDAAAPHIAAQALRDFADDDVANQTAGRIHEDLHAKADRIEAGQ